MFSKCKKIHCLCRFEANPGSPIAALTRPVVGIKEEIQGVLSREVRGRADPYSLLYSAPPGIPYPPGQGEASFSLDHHQGLLDPAISKAVHADRQVTHWL